MGLPHKLQNWFAQPFDNIGRCERHRQQQQKDWDRVLRTEHKTVKQYQIEEHVGKPDVRRMLTKIAQQAG